MIRTFIALDLDERFIDEVASLAESLRGRSRSMRWVHRDVMHVTVRFLGDTDEALVLRLQEAVRALGAGRGEVKVRARTLGAFPELRHARVLVLPLEEPRGVVEAVAKGVEAAAVDAGFSPERKPFHAHLTLARLKDRQDLRSLVAETPVDLEGRITALSLYKSELGKAAGGGPLYTALERAVF